MKQLFAALSFPLGALLTITLVPRQAQAQLLWDNGPYYNSPGTGFGGAQESVLYSTSQGMGTIAYGSNGSRLADDFTITDCRWRIDSIAVFGYQLFSGLTSTYTELTWRIWDARPGDPGSNVILGDSLTNRYLTSRWSGAYRVWEGNQGNPDRPMMRIVANMGGSELPAGTYWIDWAAFGTLGNAWFPPRTPPGQTTTGNAMHFTASTWTPCRDNFISDYQGLPFMIYGEVIGPEVEAGQDRSICVGDSTTLGGLPAASGGTGPLSMQWSPSTGLSAANSPNPFAFPTTNTAYVLTVTDSVGCVGTDTVVVALGAASANLLGPDTMVCPGTIVTLDPGPGQGFQWSNGSTSPTLPVRPGTYYVNVNNGTNCPSTDTIVISAPASAQIIGDLTFCPGDQDLICVGSGFSSILWSNGQTGYCVQVDSMGTWSVTATDTLGCVTTDTVVVGPTPVPTVAFTFFNVGLFHSFTSSVTNASLLVWHFGDGNTSTLPNPTHTYANYGTYTVKLLAYNSCYEDSLEQTTTILVGNEAQLPMEVVLSPQPASEQLRLQVQGLLPGALEVGMTDLQGRRLRTWSYTDVGHALDAQLELDGVAQGMYLLVLRQGERSVMRKVVVGR